MAQTFTHIWPIIFAGDLLRYAVGAGTVYLIVWVWWRRRLLGRRIQSHWPVSADLRREIGYSLSTVLIFSLFGYGIYLGVRHGVLRVYPDVARHGWLWWVLSIGVLVVLHDAYFYWTHRLLHHPRVFPWAHRVHHLSHTPTPWAAYAFAPAEAAVQAAFLPLVLAVLPVHSAAMFVFLVHMIGRNAIGHCGFELLPGAIARWGAWQPVTSVTHHDLHHATTRWNFGLYFTWWDRLMKTEHPEYQQRLEALTTCCRIPAETAQPASRSMPSPIERRL